MSASMFGAFELALPSGLQQRLSSIGGRGFFGAFAMGLVGGIIAAPCTGPVLASILAYVATTKSVMLGGSLLVTYALGMGVLFFAIAAFAVALPKSGAWMEGGQERLRRSSCSSPRSTSCATSCRRWPRSGARRRRGSVGSLALVAIGAILGAVHLSFHDAPAVRVRKALAVGVMVCGLYGAIAGVLAPKHEQRRARRSRGCTARTKGSRWRARCIVRRCSTSTPTGACRAKSSSSRPSAAPRWRARWRSFTLVKVNCTTDDDPTVAAAKKRWGADDAADAGAPRRGRQGRAQDRSLRQARGAAQDPRRRVLVTGPVGVGSRDRCIASTIWGAHIRHLR